MNSFSPAPIYLLPLLFSAALGPILAIAIARFRHSPGAGPLIALVLAASIWSAGYAAEIVSQGLDAKILWAKVQYLGITAIPLAWFLFCMKYLGAPAWLARFHRFRYLLGVIPALTLVLVWTNAQHLLLWQTTRLEVVGRLQMLVVEYGPWFWVYWLYSYLLLLLGSAWLTTRLIGSQGLLKWQIWLAITAVLIPWIGNLLYVTRLGPDWRIDWTPFGFSVAGLLFTISLFRFQMVKVVPIALRTAFEELGDSVLVLDLQDRVIDLNRAAQELIEPAAKRILGMPLARALPELAGTGENENGDFGGEVLLERASGAHTYELRVTTLTNQAAVAIGRLVVLHDITRRRQRQAQLEQAYALLEDRVRERTLELEQANLQLEAELDQRRLAEGRFEDIVNSSPDAILVIDAQARILLANARAEQFFGWSREELGGRILEELIPERLRSSYLESLQQFMAQPSAQQVSPQAELLALRRDGSEFPAEVYLSPLRTAEGLLIAFAIRDISAQKKAEQEQADLLQEIQESREQLRALTASLEEARELERRQIAAELHDRVGQNLTALNLNLTSIQNKLAAELEPPVQNRLVDSLGIVEETTRQVRNVMAELNPPLLDEYGLLPALQWYSERFSERTGIPIAISGEGCETRPPRRVEISLYRIIQEALNNVAKHARATQVSITCNSSHKAILLILEDDGVGFDPAGIYSGDGQPRWGLLTMRERAVSIGGRLTILSEPGKGTSLMVEVKRR